MAKSPEEMAASMIANLKEKTGKTLEQWLKVTLKTEYLKHGEILKYLKTEHGMTHGFASLVAHKTLELRQGTPQEQDLVANQYSGDKAKLKPIYDKLITAVEQMGSDVEISPKKAYVSLRRKKQFALIQPSTKTRVDVGINLKNQAPTDRLEASGSFNAMVSHRIKLTDAKQVDAELLQWLKAAYQEAG